VLLFVAILGWSVVLLTRKVTMFIDSFIPAEFEGEDLSSAHKQFAFSTVKSTVTSFCATMGESMEKFNKAFSDNELIKLTKKLGDFSAALKNIEYLITKIKEIFRWCVDGFCTFFSGRPFFQDSRNVFALRDKIEQLQKLCATESIEQMSGEQMQIFMDAYMDLVEMQPFVFRVDKWLGSQIQMTVAKAQPFYKTCKFNLQTNISRMEPYYIAMGGLPGQGKTILTEIMEKMIFDCMKMRYTETWLKFFSKDGQPVVYSDALRYNRMAEQEYWDNYVNQPFTRVDDIGQDNSTPEKRAAEFFALIRMINNAPYPLHMADIVRKESTVFSSPIVMTTTNMTEKTMLIQGELGILYPVAYLRRRDVYIDVSRKSSKYIKEGKYSKEYIEEYVLKVGRPDKMTGKVADDAWQEYRGYKDIMQLVQTMTNEMVVRYQEFKGMTHLDFTADFAFIDDRKSKIQAEIDAQDVIITRARKIADSQMEIHKALNQLHHQNAVIDGTQGEDTEDWDEDNSFEESANSIGENPFVTNVDLSDAKANMRKVRDFFYSVHPSVFVFMSFAGKIWPDNSVVTYDQVMHESAALGRPLSHDQVVNGIDIGDAKMRSSMYSAAVKYRLLALPTMVKEQYNKEMVSWVWRVLKTLPNFKDGDQKHLSSYIGLSNPLYWILTEQDSQNAIAQIFLHYNLAPPVYYDQVRADNFNYSILERIQPHMEEYLYDCVHSNDLVLTKGNSKIIALATLVAKIMASFVVIGTIVTASIWLYKALDPSREIDMEFATSQSRDPRLLKKQQEAAQRKRQVVRLDHAKKHMEDVNLEGTTRQYSDEQAETLCAKVRKNIYELQGERDGMVVNMHALGIKKNVFAVPGHFIAWKPKTLFMSRLGDEVTYEFDIEHTLWRYVRPIEGLSSADLALIHVPGMPEVQDISKHFFFKSDELNGTLGLCREDYVGTKDNIRTYKMLESPSAVKVVDSNSYLK